jgi:hypothetical protein
LAGFAIVILVFFYYTAFILLLGAVVNSWASGQRQTAGDLTALMHEVQAHNTTRGAAGPSAGTIQEDMQSRQGSQAMSSPAQALGHERITHRIHIEPPKFAEAGPPGPPKLHHRRHRRRIAHATRSRRRMAAMTTATTGVVATKGVGATNRTRPSERPESSAARSAASKAQPPAHVPSKSEPHLKKPCPVFEAMVTVLGFVAYGYRKGTAHSNLFSLQVIFR